MPLSNLTVRVTTAAAVLPLLLALLFLGPPWGWYLLVLAACIVAAQELFSMTHPGDRVAQALGVGTTAAVSLALYLFTVDARVLLTLALVVPVVGVLVPLWRLGDIRTAGLSIMAGVAGPLYVGGLLTSLADGPAAGLLGVCGLQHADDVVGIRIAGGHRAHVTRPPVGPEFLFYAGHGQKAAHVGRRG